MRIWTVLWWPADEQASVLSFPDKSCKIRLGGKSNARIWNRLHTAAGVSFGFATSNS